MSRLLSVSMPDDLMDQIEALAQEQGVTKSDVVREALRRHVLLERFRAIQRVGMAHAERLGIGPEDVEQLIDEMRGETE